jgi:hypothetical protein
MGKIIITAHWLLILAMKVGMNGFWGIHTTPNTRIIQKKRPVHFCRCKEAR